MTDKVESKVAPKVVKSGDKVKVTNTSDSAVNLTHGIIEGGKSGMATIAEFNNINSLEKSK